MTAKLERIWFYAGLTSLISVIGILIVFSDRGFDFSDEGLYALLSNPNQENRSSIINYDIIFKYLYQYFGLTFNLIELRILRLILVLLGSFYLIIPVYLLNKERIDKIISLRLFFIIGLLLGFWSYAPWFIQTPNYNSFHILGIQLFIGSLLFFHAKLISNQIIRTLIFATNFLIGFILCWLSKISAIPVLVFILLINLFLFPKKLIINYILFLIVFIIGFITFINFDNQFNTSLIQNVVEVLNQKSTSHSMSNQLNNLTICFILFILSFSFGYSLSKIVFPFKIIYLIIFFFFTCLILVFWDFERSKANNLYIPEFGIRYFVHRISIAIALILSFFTGLLIYTNKYKNNLIYLFIFHLSVLSYVIGTNNNLLYQSIGSTQFILLGWLFLNIGEFHKKILFSIIPITFLFYLSSISLSLPKGQGKWINADQKYYYGEKKYDFIYLNKESFLIQKNIKTILEKDSINKIIAYPYILGLVYLSGYSYTSPGSYLWGDEDINMYFRKKFTYPDSLQLILKGKESNEIMIPYLDNYTLTLKDSVNLYLPNRYKDSTQFYIYKCIKKI